MIFSRFLTVAAFAGATTLAANAQSTAPQIAAPVTNGPVVGTSPDFPAENPLVTSRVRVEFTNWQRGKIDRHTYSPMAGGTNSDPVVAAVAPDLKAIGDVQSVTYRSASLLLNDLVYRYDVTGTDGIVSVLYSLDQQGKTDGIVFTPQIFRATSATPLNDDASSR